MTAVSDRADWGSRAACRSADPELFFPVSGAGPSVAQIAEAKTVCARCEVRSECRSLLRTAFSGTTATSVFDNRKVALPHSKCACLLTILFTVPMSFLRMPTSCCTTYKGKCKEDDIPPDVTASWSLVTLSVTLLRRTYCKIEVRKAAFASTESTSRRRDQEKL